MKKVDVSVVIPTYNRHHLLKEALDSVFAQSWRHIEVIVVDDGSTDSSGEYLRALQRQESRLKPLFLPHSGYPGLVRNRGIEQCNGEFIAFLDSDDLWLPEKLRRQRQLLDECPQLIISHSGELWLRGERVISQRKMKHRRRGDIFADSLQKCIIGPSTVLVRRELFSRYGLFDESLEIAEDYELWLRVTAHESVAYLSEPLTIKRAGSWPQLSTKYQQIEKFRIAALKKFIYGASIKESRRAAALAELRRKSLIYAGGCRKRGRTDEALRYEALAAESI